MQLLWVTTSSAISVPGEKRQKKQYTEIFFYDLSGQTAAGFPQPIFLSSWELWGHVPKGTVP